MKHLYGLNSGMRLGVWGVVLAAGAVVAGCVIALAAPKAREAPRAAVLPGVVCAGTVHADFQPGISSAPRDVTGSGSGTLDNCYSPDGSKSELKSARFEFTGSGRPSCQQLSSVASGEVRLVWYGQPGQAGQELGRTTIHADGNAGVIGGNEASGVATPDSSVLAGAKGTVTLTVPANVQRCLFQGISSATTKVTASFEGGR
jgi:hypothetical protein